MRSHDAKKMNAAITIGSTAPGPRPGPGQQTTVAGLAREFN
ncbi:hypothetical protein SAMN06265222_102465 [Neorhodopirellula lusitana]|uniref:Uncharacterized protein n=1 Tax=Neorhodopirellula lusitana TaxID=445327 RepID=A0ABY1PVP0_9BACT|nr:hypothetical protein SAMN06265222_102465 [Neorhodopirellula lusitana]